jgi:hypothetical protein
LTINFVDETAFVEFPDNAVIDDIVDFETDAGLAAHGTQSAFSAL